MHCAVYMCWAKNLPQRLGDRLNGFINIESKRMSSDQMSSVLKTTRMFRDRQEGLFLYMPSKECTVEKAMPLKDQAKSGPVPVQKGILSKGETLCALDP